MRKNVRECLTYIRSITDFVPKAALVLGSGLGGFTEKLDSIVCEIPYSDIPGFPVSTVSGHAGKFIMGYVEDVPLICMSGRVHYYEGYAPEEVVLPLRVMHALGAEFLFLTNAAGGISSDLKPGSLVLLCDHISLFIPNPLIGENDPDEGERFPDMSEVYDPKLRELVEKAASEADVRLESGVYCQLSGPSYETPAEIRLLQRLGADVVGGLGREAGAEVRRNAYRDGSDHGPARGNEGLRDLLCLQYGRGHQYPRPQPRRGQGSGDPGSAQVHETCKGRHRHS